MGPLSYGRHGGDMIDMRTPQQDLLSAGICGCDGIYYVQ